MTNNCNLVYIDLKTNSKNTRSDIISNLVCHCDNNIIIVDKWLGGITVIPYPTTFFEAITATVSKKDVKHTFLKPTSKNIVFVAHKDKINILDEEIFTAYEEDIKMNLHFVFVLEAKENNFRFKKIKRLKIIQPIHSTRWDKIPHFLKPRIRCVDPLVNLILPKYKEEFFMFGGRYRSSGQRSLQECIGQVMQPDGSRAVSRSNIEADSVNMSISSSSTNLGQNSSEQSLYDAATNYPNFEAIERPSVTEFSTFPPSSIEEDNVQQRNGITSSRGVNTPRPCHPLYESCDSRLRSYATWRQFQQFDTFALAEAGFYNIGELNGTVVRCFFCGIELVDLAYNDNPRLEHIKKSPNCGYLKQNLGEQELAAYKEKIRSGNQSSQQTNVHAADQPSASSSTPGPWITSDHIRSPQYQAYSVRLATFARWPGDIRQRPEHVADAGFYYTGLQDVVRCFACDGGLKNFDPDDEPWIEHARWFPQCPFVRRVKGLEFINLVRQMTEESDEEEDAVVHSTFQPNNPMADAPALRTEMNIQTDQANESSVLETIAARSVIETGYPRAAVAKAINELLTKGQAEYTADDIMNIVFQMEDKGQLGQLVGKHYEDADSRPGPGSVNPVNDALSSDSGGDTNTGSVLALQQENERLRRSMQCVNCRNAKRDILLLPCTHFCLCSTCAETSSICPLCFKRIREKIKTYVI